MKLRCLLGWHDWQIIGWGNRYKKYKIARCRRCFKREPYSELLTEITGVNNAVH